MKNLYEKIVYWNVSQKRNFPSKTKESRSQVQGSSKSSSQLLIIFTIFNNFSLDNIFIPLHSIQNRLILRHIIFPFVRLTSKFQTGKFFHFLLFPVFSLVKTFPLAWWSVVKKFIHIFRLFFSPPQNIVDKLFFTPQRNEYSESLDLALNKRRLDQMRNWNELTHKFVVPSYYFYYVVRKRVEKYPANDLFSAFHHVSRREMNEKFIFSYWKWIFTLMKCSFGFWVGASVVVNSSFRP